LGQVREVPGAGQVAEVLVDGKIQVHFRFSKIYPNHFTYITNADTYKKVPEVKKWLGPFLNETPISSELDNPFCGAASF
jgi:hypothetical protein